MPTSPDSELLSQAAARRLLERAGQIDADSTTVDTLRAAALEAGISDAAFEAALLEMRRKQVSEVEPATPRLGRRLLFAVAAVMLAAMSVIFTTRGGRSAHTDMADHELVVKCLPMTVAQDIAHTLLRSPGNEVQLYSGSRVIRVRATQSQLEVLQSTFASTAKGQASCDNTPTAR